MQTDSIDWEAIERSEEFQELVRRKRNYVVPRVIFFLGWYLAFVLLAGYAEGFMDERVYEGLTVGYVLALSQFVMVWFLAVTYVRKADRDFDPLEEKVLSQVQAHTGAAPAERTGRFERTESTSGTEVPS